jgi:hypothetical protein
LPKNYKRFSSSSQFPFYFCSLLINWHEWKWMKRCQGKKTKTSRENFVFSRKMFERTKDIKSVKNPEAAAGEKLRE